MKFVKITKYYVYILTKNGHQLKVVNPGHKNEEKLYHWLEIIADDYDIALLETNQ